MPADKKESLEAKIADIKKVLENKDADAELLKNKETELMDLLQSIGSAMYANASAANAQPNPQPEQPSNTDSTKKENGNVVDADFEVVDDGEKK